MSGLLNGRRILIAGAASGIGRETLARFAAEGARLAAFDLEETAQDSDVAVFGGDISNPAACRAAITGAAAALGGLDGLVNCAGIDLEAPAAEMTAADWDRVIAVNLTGAMHLAQAALPHLRAAGSGTIVNVSSAAGLSPLSHRTAYCASKAGLNMFGKCLAMELGPEGIRVNTVCPGAVDTPLFRSSYEDYQNADERLSTIKARYAMHRVAAPSEIAGAILYLTGPDSTYVTGITMAVDGGRSFH
ncbi:SDR family oxidoreductase [Leisingera daeponensis]|uniref:SDR family oxidoreductase n=1 Tax=Leisingera daeponensis TaxID=405746 RepID=A0ABS7NLZ2_9RHOB|nr:SDR family NAD(P)-dependent oxidoreductase [Leisingera daeponensis]MBY6059048.1 SDR family oxidoreductase [Leisingera daeponensis]MBY6142214.1 SDR family oxidoreductase [Leisingera daeponensis]